MLYSVIQSKTRKFILNKHVLELELSGKTVPVTISDEYYTGEKKNRVNFSRVKLFDGEKTSPLKNWSLFTD